MLFSRSGAVLEHRVLRRGGFRSVVFQVHPGRVLVGRGHHDDSRIRWHEVTKCEQPGKTPTTTTTILYTHVPILLSKLRPLPLPLCVTTQPSTKSLWPTNTYRYIIDEQHIKTNTHKHIVELTWHNIWRVLMVNCYVFWGVNGNEKERDRVIEKKK